LRDDALVSDGHCCVCTPLCFFTDLFAFEGPWSPFRDCRRSLAKTPPVVTTPPSPWAHAFPCEEASVFFSPPVDFFYLRFPGRPFARFPSRLPPFIFLVFCSFLGLPALVCEVLLIFPLPCTAFSIFQSRSMTFPCQRQFPLTLALAVRPSGFPVPPNWDRRFFLMML